MVYILETEILDNKPLIFSLGSIYGIGQAQSRLVCRKLGFSENLTMLDLTKKQISELVQLIEKSKLILTNDLKKFQLMLLQQKVEIRSYKGLRCIRGLPVRGQRTRTNAKSAKRFRKDK